MKLHSTHTKTVQEKEEIRETADKIIQKKKLIY